MRANRNKNANNPPLVLKNARTEQSRIASQKDKGAIKETIYKGAKIVINNPQDYYHGKEEFEIRYKLRILYHNKCAYCERIEYKPDVEHYRPKKQITGLQSNDHGYYWLCYEWTNLLPACSACNSRNGKGNKFPVLGTRVTTPPLRVNGTLFWERCRANHSYNLSEQPGLLHPEVDNPENFLVLNWNGELSPLDGNSGRGFHTIETCDLNRGNLIFSRKKIIDDFIERIKAAFVSFRNGDLPTPGNLKNTLIIALNLIKEESDPSCEYSFVAFYIWKHFAAFVNDNFAIIAQEESDLLIQTYQELT